MFGCFLTPLLLRPWKENRSYLMSVCLCHSVESVQCYAHSFLHLAHRGFSAAQLVLPKCEIGKLDLQARIIKDLREEPALHPSEIYEYGLVNRTEIQPGLDKSRMFVWSSPLLTHTAVCSGGPPGLSELGWYLYLL